VIARRLNGFISEFPDLCGILLLGWIVPAKTGFLSIPLARRQWPLWRLLGAALPPHVSRTAFRDCFFTADHRASVRNAGDRLSLRL